MTCRVSDNIDSLEFEHFGLPVYWCRFFPVIGLLYFFFARIRNPGIPAFVARVHAEPIAHFLVTFLRVFIKSICNKKKWNQHIVTRARLFNWKYDARILINYISNARTSISLTNDPLYGLYRFNASNDEKPMFAKANAI